MPGLQEQNHVDMMSIVDQTGKRRKQRLAEGLSHANEQLDTGFMVSLFSMVSNINKVAQYIEKGAKYIFPLAFALKLADWVLYALKYKSASNRNTGKTANLVLKTLSVPVIGLAVFGGAIFAPIVAPLLFSGVVGLELLISLGKSIYFGIKSIGKPDHEKAFYSGKAKQNAIKTGVLGLALSVILTGLVFAPHVMVPVVATIAVVAVAVMVTLTIVNFVKRIRAQRAAKALADKPDTKPEADNKLELVKENKAAIAVGKDEVKTTSSSMEQAPLLAEKKDSLSFLPSTKIGFFDNSAKLRAPITRAITMADIEELQENIEKYRKKIDIEMTKENDGAFKKHLWSESEKRDKKITTLNFLLAVTDKDKLKEIYNNLSKNELPRKTVVFGPNAKDTIPYKNINELVREIDVRLSNDRNNGPFQSFFKDIGGVETLVKQTYKLLIAMSQYGLEVAEPKNEFRPN